MTQYDRKYLKYMGSDFILKTFCFDIPRKGELYMDKNGEINRWPYEQHSRRAQKRIIFKEFGFRKCK